MTSRTTDVVLGIDLGTTFSCAAYMKDGRPKIIPSERGYATVPSVVGLTRKGEIVVGHPALDQMVVKPEETIYSSKRLIGRKFNSLIVQRMREKMMYPIVEGENAEAAVILGAKQYGLAEISSLILTEIREVAQHYLDHEVHRAVITVPAYYSDNQRHAVRKAGELAGLKVERIINEPTAAALAYGYNKGFDQNVLIYDLGGGTFDISVLNIKGNEYRVLATGGDTFLGGVDFDQRLVDFVLHKFAEATGKHIDTERVAVERIRAASERAKRELSVEKTTKIQLPYITQVDGSPIDLNFSLTRDQLNKLTGDLVQRTFEICERVLASGKIRPDQVDEILLVGGQTRMPLVQESIQKHFGKAPRKGVHPDEVVASGAAILGGTLAAATPVKLHDVLAMPIGIALPNGNVKIILTHNTPIPASKSYKVTLPAGKGLNIDVYQGDQTSVLDNEYLGTFQFPSAKQESVVELTFELTEECLLTVHVRRPKTGERISSQMVTLQTPPSLKQMLASASTGKKADRLLSSFAHRVLGK